VRRWFAVLPIALVACSGSIDATDAQSSGDDSTSIENPGTAGSGGTQSSSTSSMISGASGSVGSSMGSAGSTASGGSGGSAGIGGSTGSGGSKGHGGSSGAGGASGSGGSGKGGAGGSGGAGAAGASGMGGAGGSMNVTSGFADIVNESLFNQMFPKRNSFYTYQGLVEATKLYPSFASEGTIDVRKREAAAFLANMARETGELVYIEQIAKAPYCQDSAMYPCAPGQQYYGRGPIQISWNYNYGAAGDALGVNLLADPGLVARDAKVAWATGLWFWSTSKPNGDTCHSAMTKSLGFGATVNIINGAVECGGRDPSAVQDRVDHYQTYCSMLGVSPGANVSC
jgi:predicted chitinase